MRSRSRLQYSTVLRLSARVPAILACYLVLLGGVTLAQQLTLNSNSESGRNYYISPKGNDWNDGSVKHPWATITQAGSRVQPRDTVHLMPGTYPGQIATSASGTADARIVYVS